MSAAEAGRTVVAATLAALTGIAGGRYLLPVSVAAVDEQVTVVDENEAEPEPFLMDIYFFSGPRACVGGEWDEQFHLHMGPYELRSGFYQYAFREEYRPVDDLLAAIREREDPWVMLWVPRHVTYDRLYHVTGVLRDAGVTCVTVLDSFNPARCRSSPDGPWRYCRGKRGY